MTMTMMVIDKNKERLDDKKTGEDCVGQRLQL